MLSMDHEHSQSKLWLWLIMPLARPRRMVDLQKRLNDLLQGTAKKGLKLSVTPCILAELQSLGADFQGQC